MPSTTPFQRRAFAVMGMFTVHGKLRGGWLNFRHAYTTNVEIGLRQAAEIRARPLNEN